MHNKSGYDNKMGNKFPVLYTPTEVAEMAKVSRRTVYRWIESGYLPARKIGMGEAWTIVDSDVRALLSGTLRGRKLKPITDANQETPSATPRKGAARPGRRS
jgi:excisionase family DNA binding protein